MHDMKHTLSRLFKPIDIMPLVFFRILFGGIMIWEVWRYFHFDRINRYYIEPQYTFHYWGFEWVKPLSGDGMIWLFYVVAILASFIMIGFLYRFAMIAFWLSITYIFLLDQTQYLNHIYLISLVSFLMIWIPAHRKWALDAWLRPKSRSETAPAWGLGLLRGQMAIVYVYGGIAKINPDWLRGEPMRTWLSERTSFPLIGHQFTQEWMVYGFSYGGLLFDLLIVPMLFWHRTRWFALGLLFLFHLTNHMLFNIGIFPHFAFGISLLFLPPHWFRFCQTPIPTAPSLTFLNPKRILLLICVALYFFIQIVLPLRHFLYPGYVSWTEEGHNLAWHMRLRSKAGDITFYAVDTTSGFVRDIPIQDYLNARQIDQMSDQPLMILRFAHYLSGQSTYQNQQIHVWSMMSLNERASQLLLDPTVNLVDEVDDLGHDDWILPLYQAPYPADATPTLLISRRIDGVLIIINITQEAIPMKELILTIGAYDITAEHLLLDELAPDACLVVHEEGADISYVLPICNEATQRINLPSHVVNIDELSQIGVNPDYMIDCILSYCIVTYTSD